jgi:hypothetical protein
MIDKNDIEKLQSDLVSMQNFMHYLNDFKDALWPSDITLTIDTKKLRVLTIGDSKLIREMVRFAYTEMEKNRKEIIDALSENSNT